VNRIYIYFETDFCKLNILEQGPLPSIEELEKSVSVMLINSHNVFSRPRPKLPGLIDIAGLHIRKPKPLPLDIQVSKMHYLIRLTLHFLSIFRTSLTSIHQKALFISALVLTYAHQQCLSRHCNYF
jgi:hypothetical protein